MIRIGLILFPGSNCERETALAVKRAGMEPVEVLWNEAPELLATLDGYVLIGGFSYEDRSRAGIIAALQPIMDVIRQQSAQGKPVLGICNGAQILVESGMITDLSQPEGIMALAENKRIQNEHLLGTGFYNQWVHLRVCDRPAVNAFTRHLSAGECMHLPIAHAEGRFTMPEALYSHLHQKGLNLFQYCDAEGAVKDNFPVNPNGSMGNLAAVINEAGNVMAMMPHPERTPNGDALFTSMREYIAEGERLLPAISKGRQAVEKGLETFMSTPSSQQYLIQQVITDNQAMTVQKTLQQLGFPVQVKRFVHWEIDCALEDDLKTLLDSGVLYCARKEICLKPERVIDKNSAAYLVADKEDVKGREALQTLTRFYGVPSLKKLQQRTLWQFSSTTADIHALMPQILATHIIGNPHAHDCYEFKH